MKQEERDRQLKRRKLVGAVIGVGIFAAAVTAGCIYDINHFSIAEINHEIDIHSGIAETPDGHHIDPFSEHGCEVPNDGRTFEERLAERMYEDGYHQETVEAAIEKFELQCDGELKMARDIKLRQIERLAKESDVKHR